MKVRISRIDKGLPLPKYETAGAAAFDFLARTTTKIDARSLGLVPGNVVVETPKGYMLAIVPRSSTPRKYGLLIPHGVGVIDSDYCGPEDEVMVQVFNFTDKMVVVERGERVAQGIFVKIARGELTETKINRRTRGGFGSTG